MDNAPTDKSAEDSVPQFSGEHKYILFVTPSYCFERSAAK